MSFRKIVAVVGLSLTVLSGCASTSPQQTASRCYWPGPVTQPCSEMIEFNSWH